MAKIVRVDMAARKDLGGPAHGILVGLMEMICANYIPAIADQFAYIHSCIDILGFKLRPIYTGSS